MDELIVVDDEYEELKSTLGEFGDAAEEQLKEYLRIVDALCDTAITEGQVAQNLKTFTQHAKSMQDKTKELTDFMQSACSGFIQAIDDGDEYLYD